MSFRYTELTPGDVVEVVRIKGGVTTTIVGPVSPSFNYEGFYVGDEFPKVFISSLSGDVHSVKIIERALQPGIYLVKRSGISDLSLNDTTPRRWTGSVWRALEPGGNGEKPRSHFTPVGTIELFDPLDEVSP